MARFFVFNPQRLYLGSFSGEAAPTDSMNFYVIATRALHDQLDAARIEQENEFLRTGEDQERMVHDPTARTITAAHLRGE